LAEEGGLDSGSLYTEPKLKSPAQVEKLGADKDQRKTVKALVGKLAYMPDGKLTVALDSDPRPAVDPHMLAAEEFADDSDEGEF